MKIAGVFCWRDEGYGACFVGDGGCKSGGRRVFLLECGCVAKGLFLLVMAVGKQMVCCRCCVWGREVVSGAAMRESGFCR